MHPSQEARICCRCLNWKQCCEHCTATAAQRMAIMCAIKSRMMCGPHAQANEQPHNLCRRRSNVTRVACGCSTTASLAASISISLSVTGIDPGDRQSEVVSKRAGLIVIPLFWQPRRPATMAPAAG